MRRAAALLAVSTVLAMGGCGGGGGGGDSSTPAGPPPIPPAPNSAINATTSYRYQNTPAPTDIGTLLAANGLSGHFFDARQYVDLDGDGVNEIVVAPGQVASASARPVKIFRRTASGSYADATSTLLATVPGQVHPRKVIAQDFNGDGRLDLYFVDHGLDQSPFPGAQNVLMLSNLATGKLEQKTIVNNPTAFQHCATAGDINNNGAVDIFVCAEAWQGPQKAPYLLLNDGAGNMTITRTGVPASLVGGTTAVGMLAAELTDVDGDGFLDLVAAYRSQSAAATSFISTIFWGDGTGSFADASSTVIPNPASFVATYDIKAQDIDGDGRRDLVLLRVTSALSGYYIQILRQTATRSFADESLTRIIGNAATWEGNGAPWFPWLHMADIEGDGSLDILIGDQSGQIPARNLRWANNGQGVFTKLH